MREDINGNRLRMARIMRKLSSPKLASLIEVTKQAVWQYENQQANPLPDTMLKICSVLGFPRQFFYEGYNEIYELGKSYCRTSTATTKAAKEAQQHYNILRVLLYRYFSNYIEFPPINFPNFVHSEFDDMEAYALAVREFYGLGESPIVNMANFLENIGIILSTYYHSDNKFDGLSSAPLVDKERYRVTIYNLENTTFSRLQFTLGHELGHWLLGHIDSDEDTLTAEDYRDNEKEANLFASCLLLPKQAFINDMINPTDLSSYVPLKRKWKVSIAMMVMRARNLELIDYQQYQNLYKQLSRKGWRTSEPYDDFAIVPIPTLLPEAVELLDTHNIVKKTSLVRELSNSCFSAHQGLYESLLNLKEHSLDALYGDNTPKLRLIR